MESRDDDSFDASRAEVFEALGHPTRIRILKALSGGPLGFSELKREVGIGSGGLLSFHIGKLSGLVKPTQEGDYALSEEGREALRTVEASRAVSGTNGGKAKGLTERHSMSRPLLAALLVAIVALGAVAVYQQEQITMLNRDAESISKNLGQTPLNHAPSDPAVASFSSSWYQNGSLWAAPSAAYQGRWYAGVGMKVLWYRSDGGTFGQQLQVSGTRLDGSAPQMSNTFQLAYKGYDYQPSSLLFPTDGWWNVTGRIGNLSLSFVAYVYPHSACQDPNICST